LTVIISENCPFDNVVALFKQEHGSVMLGAQVTVETVTVPVIEFEQVVTGFVATTVYEPIVPWGPNVIAFPVPGTTAPVGTAFTNNW
jgi:hypothetical protein